MTTTITEYIDVRETCARMHLSLSSDFAILPVGFDGASASGGEFAMHAEASTMRKLLVEAGIHVTDFSQDVRIPTDIRKSADWLAPTFFVASSIWSQNPTAVSIALSVLSTYIAELLRPAILTESVKFRFAIESSRGKTTKLLSYDGPLDGLKSLDETLRRLADE